MFNVRSHAVLGGVLAAAFTCQAECAIVGTYEGVIAMGGDRLKVALRCAGETDCELGSGSASTSAPPSRFAATPISDLRELRASLQFARERKDLPTTNEEMRAVREAVRPLLDSNADLSRCIRLAVGSNVCELTASPWGKPTVIFFGANLANCRAESVFCGYVLFPLFQTAKTAVMLGSKPFVPARFSPPPPAPEIQDYVKSVQDKVQALFKAPPGMKPDAVLFQIQFNQETGNYHFASVMDDCSCQDIRKAAATAVKAAWPLPLLPKEKWHFLEGRNAKLYIVLRAAP